MKSYTITVNGTAYEVTVEETGSVSAPAAAAPCSSSEGSTCTEGSSEGSSREQAQLRLQLPYLERF